MMRSMASQRPLDSSRVSNTSNWKLGTACSICAALLVPCWLENQTGVLLMKYFSIHSAGQWLEFGSNVRVVTSHDDISTRRGYSGASDYQSPIFRDIPELSRTHETLFR